MRFRIYNIDFSRFEESLDGLYLEGAPREGDQIFVMYAGDLHVLGVKRLIWLATTPEDRVRPIIAVNGPFKLVGDLAEHSELLKHGLKGEPN